MFTNRCSDPPRADDHRHRGDDLCRCSRLPLSKLGVRLQAKQARDDEEKRQALDK